MKAALFFIVALSSGCATVGPGSVGVLWTTSGGTQSKIYGEGLHAVAGWNQMYIYDLRAMSQDEVLNVIASNGLSIKLEASVRYQLLGDEIVALHKDIGPDYYQKILEPVLRSEGRRVFGRYTPEEIYSTKREVIEREIREGVKEKIAGMHIDLKAVLIRNVDLPPAIRQAIDQKLEAEQEVLKMKYVLEVSKAQADQKHIEAEAVADYNKVVTSSLSPGILDYERIQQLTAIAKSGNAKTVVIGGSNAQQLLVNPSGTK